MNSIDAVRNWIGIVLAIFILAGCGTKGQVKVYPVKGRVNFDGKPMVGGGSIAFIPNGGTATKDSGAEINADGTYELMTYVAGDGAMAGDYRVVITQVVFKEPEAVADGAGAAPAPTAAVSEADRIPAIYSDFTNSPLTGKVEEKPSNELNFELKRL